MATIFWFAFSRWPILDYVQSDWRIQKLERDKNILDQKRETLSQKILDLKIFDKKSQFSATEPLNDYKKIKRQSEEFFMKALKYEDGSAEREHFFRLGKEYREKAEELEKKLSKQE